MMYKELPPPVGHDRPFPWTCIECREKAVFPTPTDYSIECKHDGRSYMIRIPDLEIPTCQKCGEQVFTSAEDDRIVAALRARVGLLTPEEIHQHRTEFNLTQQELAGQLGVPIENISRWEEGGLIQSRAEDNLLRLFYEFPEARKLLERRVTQPQN